MKKLVLHIGMPKSASSTIQNFLARNRDELIKRGVFIPNTLGGENHRFIYSMARFAFNRDDAALRVRNLTSNEERKAFIKKIEKKFESEMSSLEDGSKTVISCEQLASLSKEEVAFLKEKLASFFGEISVVCYFRRQDLMLVSGYNTQVISGRYQLFNEKFSFPSSPPDYLNYEHILNKWSDAFGEKSIIVRTVDEKYMVGGSIISDFSDILGCGVKGLKTDGFRENASLPASLIEFIRRLNRVLDDQGLDEYQKASISMITLPVAKKTKLKGVKFKPAIRESQNFYSFFSDSNKNIALRFLGREELFSTDFSSYPEETTNPSDEEILNAGLEFVKQYILQEIKK